MSLFRRNNYVTKRTVEDGGLPSLLRTYGSVGGANARVEQLSRAKAEEAERKGLPSIVARIYAPTTMDIAPLPFESRNNQPSSMVERIYQPETKGGNK